MENFRLFSLLRNAFDEKTLLKPEVDSLSKEESYVSRKKFKRPCFEICGVAECLVGLVTVKGQETTSESEDVSSCNQVKDEIRYLDKVILESEDRIKEIIAAGEEGYLLKEADRVALLKKQYEYANVELMKAISRGDDPQKIKKLRETRNESPARGESDQRRLEMRIKIPKGELLDREKASFKGHRRSRQVTEDMLKQYKCDCSPAAEGSRQKSVGLTPCKNPDSPTLCSSWPEEESGWTSTWTLRPGTNIYDASYTGLQGQSGKTVNTVSINGQTFGGT